MVSPLPACAGVLLGESLPGSLAVEDAARDHLVTPHRVHCLQTQHPVSFTDRTLKEVVGLAEGPGESAAPAGPRGLVASD
eukprot:9095123-Alexandrium_andersonii.AAC.1